MWGSLGECGGRGGCGAEATVGISGVWGRGGVGVWGCGGVGLWCPLNSRLATEHGLGGVISFIPTTENASV